MANLLLVIVALFCPPLAVAIKLEDLSTHFWINLCLTILGWFPGVIHALFVILSEKA